MHPTRRGIGAAPAGMTPPALALQGWAALPGDGGRLETMENKKIDTAKKKAEA